MGTTLALALSLAAVTQRIEAARLRNANQSLQREVNTLRTQAEALAAEKREYVRQLAALSDRHGELASRVAELEAADAADASFATSQVALKPYQAEAFLGRKPLGLVWIVPRNLRMDSNTQRLVYEPVVCLDEKLRGKFEVHHTNTIEQVVETPVYVNNNYFNEPYSYPIRYWPRQTNIWPNQPGSAPQPNPPSFNPGNRTIIKQPIGTPAEKIKTYPTAPRLPTTPAPKSPNALPPTPTLPQANTLRAASF